eukprot:g20043.t1
MENKAHNSNSSGIADSTTKVGMPPVDVKVSRFAKHPSGHTVYECVVGLPQTRQVWLVFRRYREFVTLRQRLKSACQGHHQKHSAPPARGDTKPHAPAKRLSGRVDSTPGPAASEIGLAIGTGNKTGWIGAGGASASSSLIGSVETILSECRFPSRLAIGRSFSLRQERRKALHSFLNALTQLRPLPRVVARFLGLLENDRMALDRGGNYVLVTQVDSVLPMPPCPDLGGGGPSERVLTAQDGRDADFRNQPPSASEDRRAATGELGAQEEEGNADEDHVSATAPSSPTATRGGGDSGDEPTLVARGIVPAASALAEAANSGAGRYQQQPSVGSRAWAGVVRTVEMAASSDTEDPTDSESGSDSEPEYPDDTGDESISGDQNRGSIATGLDAAGVDEGGLDRGSREGGFNGVSGGVDELRALVADVSTVQQKRLASTADTAAASAAAGPPSLRLSVARLRGGGGGDGSDEESDDAGAKNIVAWRDGEQTDGWSMVASEEGDTDDEGHGGGGAGARVAGGEECAAGGAGCPEEKQEREGERQERMLQWEFVNGYLEEVVAKVVGRQDLSVGMGTSIASGTHRGGSTGRDSGGGLGDGKTSLLPLSEEERDVRLAELMSFGVDLPNDMLITLLRFKDWGPTSATALYQDLVAAGKGQLNAVTPGAPVRGMANGGNTCYIDSLLFAMFATLDAFDWLLFKPLPPTDPPQVKLLQKHLRFLVNQLRGGATVPREHSNLIRNHLRTCGWQGGPSSQEDVTELFTFLVCLLRCPALPLSEALFHGGKGEPGDSRISTERALFLALPDEENAPERKKPKSLSPTRSRKAGSFTYPNGSRSPPRRIKNFSPGESQDTGPAASAVRNDGSKDAAGGGVVPGVTLEQILMHNFHNNRVEGLRRTISGEKGSQVSFR